VTGGQGSTTVLPDEHRLGFDVEDLVRTFLDEVNRGRSVQQVEVFQQTHR